MIFIRMLLLNIFFSLCICTKPNIVFILTDDQDVMLDGADHQPKIAKLLAEQGLTLKNQFAATPVCCPSRSSYLSGKHIHNIPMTNNSIAGNCSGPHWNQGPEKFTVGVQLQALGYNTAFFGKYLNQYGSDKAGGVAHVPPGWNTWLGLRGNSQYYNYVLSNNGEAEPHGDSYEEDYLTDLLKNRTLKFLDSVKKDSPFFAMVSTPAAHGPHIPAPQYAYTYTNSSFANAPRTPNFGMNSQDKHWFVQTQGEVWLKNSEKRTKFIDWEHVRRLEALLSVDDLVEAVVMKLKSMDVLDNTYIFYSSDHGYHLGQFSLMKDKRFPYEHDIRVPGYVRGPGIPKGHKSDVVVLNIDMLPTFIDIAGGEIPDYVDGKSVLGELTDDKFSAAANRTFLVEYHGEGGKSGPNVCKDQFVPGMACFIEATEPRAPYFDGHKPICSCQDSRNNTYSCARSLTPKEDILYCEFVDDLDFKEYYDVREDKWQRKNQFSQLDDSEKSRLQMSLERLKRCKGSSCHSFQM